MQQLFGDLEHIDELCELVEELRPAADRDSALVVGGHCVEIGGQDTPWTQMARANLEHRHGADLSRSERVRLRGVEEDRLIREWVPLVQFHTRSDFYYGCFLISSDDLAAKRFDKVRSFTMFTE